MYVNPGYDIDIIPLRPSGTNSTMFTVCCEVAICDYETKCPVCKRLVVGHDEPTDHRRGLARWRNATNHWNRKDKT